MFLWFLLNLEVSLLLLNINVTGFTPSWPPSVSLFCVIFQFPSVHFFLSSHDSLSSFAFPFLHASIRSSSPRVMTPLQSSQEADSPLLLLSSSAPAIAFYLSSTFTPVSSVPLCFSAARPLLRSLIHPCQGALVTSLAVAMATCIQTIFCWKPLGDPVRPP